MVSFLVKYWRLILEVILLIISVVVLVLKKKPVEIYDTFKTDLIHIIPLAISAAENTDLKGADKLQYAIDVIYDYFARDYLTRKEFDNNYLSFVKKEIELILSTPQKKEVKHEEQN